MATGRRLLWAALLLAGPVPFFLVERGTEPVAALLLLLAASLATHSILPHVYRNVPYDPVRDFTPVALFAIVPNLMTSGLSFAPNNVRELVALAKSKPGSINYASAGAGSSGCRMKRARMVASSA